MEEDPPPPYEFKESALKSYPQRPQGALSSSTSTSAYDQPPPSEQQQQRQQQPPFSTLAPLLTSLYASAPVGLYTAGFADVHLALSGSSPALNYITIHSLRTPSITLHENPSPDSPAVATAQYNFMSATDVEVLARPSSTWGSAGAGGIKTELVKTGWLPDAWGFGMTIGGAGGGPPAQLREKFEWRYSHNALVAALDGKSRGLKCVRVSTGEIVCVWAWSVSMSKKGKFRWLLGGGGSGNGGWSEDAVLMVLITLLTVVERIRRDEQRS